MSLTFHLIPHVHWDREWYLTRHGFLARLVPMLDGLLDLLEAHPALRYHLDGQTVILEDYLAVAPQRRDRVRAAVERGQLAIGPWYVLADELIPRGASLRKNLELGLATAASLGGHSRVLYSPDAFGHPAGLPDLAAEFGLPWALVWRGLGYVHGQDRDFYLWVGSGGHSVLLYHLPPEGYEMGADLVDAGAELPGRWRRLRDRMVARAVTDQVAVLVGADHHAPSAELPYLAERIAALEPDAEVRFSRLDELFAAVEAKSPTLYGVQGELRDSAGYVWSLQGVHATRARLKRRHAEVESALLDVVEPLVAALGERRPPLLDEAWRLLIQSQFHDTLAGCAADGVAREQQVRLDGVAAIAGELATTSLDRLIDHDPDAARDEPAGPSPVLVLWNPETEPYRGVVIARTTWFTRDILVGPPGDRTPDTGPGFRPFHLRAPDGTNIPVQVLRIAEGIERVDAPRHYPDLDLVDEAWIAVRVDDLPPREPVVLAAVAGTAPGSPIPAARSVRAAERSLENEAIRVTADGEGSFTLVDLETGRWVQDIGRIESETDRGDLYTPAIDPATRREARLLGVRRVAPGPLVGALELSWVLEPAGGGTVRGRTVLSLHAGEPVVHLRIELDNQATDHRLRVRLPLELGRGVMAGTPFGAVWREAGRLDTAWAGEAVLPTAPAHGVLTPADGEGGAFGLHAPGFIEYELTERGELLITLLRSVGTLSRDDLPTRRGHAGWAMATPDAQELGRHVIDLAVGTRPARRHPVVRWIRNRSRESPNETP